MTEPEIFKQAAKDVMGPFIKVVLPIILAIVAYVGFLIGLSILIGTVTHFMFGVLFFIVSVVCSIGLAIAIVERAEQIEKEQKRVNSRVLR